MFLKDFTRKKIVARTLSLRLSVALALLAALAAASCAKAQSKPQTQQVAMSDGIELATDVYLPEGKGPFPTILIRTPYNKAGNRGNAANLTKLGYALVVQDMRGRYESKGHHAIIFGNDGLGGKHQDGHDTLNWIAKQEWSDGKVATYGGSALGIVQNMQAPGAPAALKGQMASVAFSDYYSQAAYQGGVWRQELLEGWLRSTKMEETNLSTFLEHSTYDDFWKKLSTPTRSMPPASSSAAGTTSSCRGRSTPLLRSRSAAVLMPAASAFSSSPPLLTARLTRSGTIQISLKLRSITSRR
jgi:putative CocE/NonD family hydrolase